MGPQSGLARQQKWPGESPSECREREVRRTAFGPHGSAPPPPTKYSHVLFSLCSPASKILLVHLRGWIGWQLGGSVPLGNAHLSTQMIAFWVPSGLRPERGLKVPFLVRQLPCQQCVVPYDPHIKTACGQQSFC